MLAGVRRLVAALEREVGALYGRNRRKLEGSWGGGEGRGGVGSALMLV